eukprot:m.260303 g.260303  ORF g.260303 m.260303 type:complete len:55 (-) comp39639_c0_seq1:1256-1420(-)
MKTHTCMMLVDSWSELDDCGGVFEQEDEISSSDVGDQHSSHPSWSNLEFTARKI